GSGGGGSGGAPGPGCDGVDCILPDGDLGICEIVCGPCPSDQRCSDVYGAGTLCIGGGCFVNGCRTAADCGGGKVCDGATHLCKACGTDPTCVAGYGAGHLCIAGACVSGDCHTTADCTGGKLCDPATNA